MHLARLPWAALLSASILHLGRYLIYDLFFCSFFFLQLTIFHFVSAANMLGNFSIALTYNLFITLGLITAVPVSAGTIFSY